MQSKIKIYQKKIIKKDESIFSAIVDAMTVIIILLFLLLLNCYAIKYLCAEESSFAGSTVAICPSNFTSYVSGSIDISGVLSFHIISCLLIFLQFFTGKITFSNSNFSGTPSSMAFFDIKVNDVLFTALPNAP